MTSTHAPMTRATPRSVVGFDPVATALQVVYLLLGLPLGVLAFVSLITVFSLGAGLSIIMIGFPILVFGVMLIRLFAELERGAADYLLGASFETPPPTRILPQSWSELRSMFTSGSTWRHALFLVLRLPLGILGFVAAITLTSVPLALFLAPVAFSFDLPWQINFGIWRIDTLQDSWIACVLGLFLGFLSVFLINGLSVFYRWWAEQMLD